MPVLSDIQNPRTTPIHMDCLGCGERWHVPGDFGCGNCEPGTQADLDDRIWQVGQIPGHEIFISAHLRDEDRFKAIIDAGIRTIINVANDPLHVHSWEPEDYSPAQIVHIHGIDDNGQGFRWRAIHTVVKALTLHELKRRVPVLIHCSAGLRRSPHLVYAYLRAKGHPQGEAWQMVQAARPFAWPHLDYLKSVERYLARGRLGILEGYPSSD